MCRENGGAPIIARQQLQCVSRDTPQLERRAPTRVPSPIPIHSYLQHEPFSINTTDSTFPLGPAINLICADRRARARASFHRHIADVYRARISASN